MSEWIEYTGSDEQLLEIMHAPRGYKYRNNKGYESGILIACGSLINLCNELQDDSVTHYLICQPHPYADLIKIWADTGCPVYAKHKATGQTDEVCGPRVDWNHEEWEFSLTPFED